MKIVAICGLGFFFLSTGLSLGQVKFEKEYRLEAAKVPLPARQFVDSLDFGRRVRWYMETSEKSKSIEAKSKRNCQRFSVEFGLAGELQDVEIEIRWKDLPEVLRETIQQSLDAEFRRFKIKKVQRQLTGEREEILDYLRQRGDGKSLTTRYEIVLKGKKDGEVSEFEYTFSDEGRLEKRAKVVFRNTDNLEY